MTKISDARMLHEIWRAGMVDDLVGFAASLISIEDHTHKLAAVKTTDSPLR
jgi:hypothetical protein